MRQVLKAMETKNGEDELDYDVTTCKSTQKSQGEDPTGRAERFEVQQVSCVMRNVFFFCSFLPI